MEPVNAKYFDPDTGLPLDGTHSLSISEVFAQGLRWLKENFRPLDEGYPFTGGGSGGNKCMGGSVALGDGIGLFDHYDSGCDDPSNPASGCYMDDDSL